MKYVSARTLVCTIFIALLLVGISYAGEEGFYSFGWSGQGSLMQSPMVYSGTFAYGLAGTWEIVVDDSDWPPPLTQERFDYIWNHFFASNYDTTGPLSWTGYFNASTLQSTPTFTFTTTFPGGTVGGTCPFTILVMDNTPNGQLDPWEWDNLRFAANLAVDPSYGSEAFTWQCGWGSMNAIDFDFPNPYDAIDYVGQVQVGSGTMFTYLCSSPTEPAAWGSIKALFED